MKKAILIVFTVAILGLLGINAQKHGATSPASSSIGSSQTPDTASAATDSTNATATPVNISYADGTYKGNTINTPYGEVQVAVTISGGKITDINFLQMPNDRGYSREVTAYVEPLLKQNTLQKQSSSIDFISGATSTSYGYQTSLQAALDKAHNA